MRMVFFNIAWMRYYKGRIGGDEPKYGGKYVVETGDAHEQYNFKAEYITFEDGSMKDGEYCLGYVESKHTKNGDKKQLHIERISGCEDCKKESSVENVTVIFCAKHPNPDDKGTYVVGWYRNATVFRLPQSAYFDIENGETYTQLYFTIAKKEDCVLLPVSKRLSEKWVIPRKMTWNKFGFGQSNQWYARNEDNNPQLDDFLKNIYSNIIDYKGENWIDKYPEE